MLSATPTLLKSIISQSNRTGAELPHQQAAPVAPPAAVAVSTSATLSLAGFTGPITVQTYSLNGQTLTITKSLDQNSPRLMQYLASGKHIASGNLLITTTSANGTTQTSEQLVDLLVTSETTIGNGTAEPVETIVFQLGEVTSSGNAAAVTANSASASSTLSTSALLAINGISGQTSLFSYVLSGQDLIITKAVDQTSPSFAKCCATGQHMASGTLTLIQASGPAVGTVTAIYSFSDVMIASDTISGSTADGSHPVETIDVHFGSEQMS